VGAAQGLGDVPKICWRPWRSCIQEKRHNPDPDLLGREDSRPFWEEDREAIEGLNPRRDVMVQPR